MAAPAEAKMQLDSNELWAITAERPNNSDATHVDLEYQIVGTAEKNKRDKN